MKAVFNDLLAQPFWLLAQGGQETGVGTPVETGDGVTGAPDTSLLTQILGNPLNLILISGILFLLLVLP